jgi:IS605 OrfB family transposase
MQLSIKVKLIPTQEQRDVLLKTIKTYNDACNFVSQIAFENKTASVVKIHHKCYYEIRKRFNLSSQMAVRVVGKVADAYKVARNKKLQLKKPHKFAKYGAIVYDQRIFSWKGLEKVSILTLEGRQVIPIVFGEYQQIKLQFPRRGQADLIYQNGNFYLMPIVDIPEPPQKISKDFLGVDLGVVNLAVDSKGEFYSGKGVEKKRIKLDKLKSALQKCGSKSAKRHLKKLSGKESRFRTWINHNISKKIVEKAKRHSLSIAIENLTGIRQRATVRKSQRRQYSSWAFNQLRRFLEYKSKLAGIVLKAVDPHYTSQKCSNCGYIAKHNRKNQSNFSCKSCGFSVHADLNGAINIAQLAKVNLPIVAPARGVTSH